MRGSLRAPRVVVLALLTLVLWPATALAVDGDGELTFKVPLQATHGLSAVLEVDDDEIELKISKRRQMAVYFGRGEVSPERIDVEFGRLGEFVADYKPFRTLKERGPNRHCVGEPRTTTEGFLRGTLRFRGERGYVLVDATRAKVTLEHHPGWSCDYRNRSAAASRARSASEKADVASLAVRSRDRSVELVVFGGQAEDGRNRAYFWATSQEVREGIGIVRFTTPGAPAAGFEFDHQRGTASIDPPAPFGGSARYLRRPGADRWTGSLTVPLLGLGRVPLTGPGFSAVLMRRVPEFR